MPPSPVTTVFVRWKLNTEPTPNLPARVPLYVDPSASAESSIVIGGEFLLEHLNIAIVVPAVSHGIFDDFDLMLRDPRAGHIDGIHLRPPLLPHDWLCGNAYNRRAIGNIAGDHRAGTDNGVGADRDA